MDTDMEMNIGMDNEHAHESGRNKKMKINRFIASKQ
jgi:hypothetical protein